MANLGVMAVTSLTGYNGGVSSSASTYPGLADTVCHLHEDVPFIDLDQHCLVRIGIVLSTYDQVQYI